MIEAALTNTQAGKGWSAKPGFSLFRAMPWLLLALVLALVVGPLAILLLTSFGKAGTLPFQGLSFTFDNYLDIATRPGTGRLIWNTVFYSALSIVMGIALAVSLAWLTERTDMAGRTLIRILMFSWMAVPPLVFGYGWILAINPGNGAVNVLIKSIFGPEALTLTPYSMLALIVISGLSLVPTSYVMISGLLRNMDPSLEDAGFVLGASRWKVIKTITLPVLSPGLLSVGMFLFIGMVQTFDLPLVIGATAQIPVLSTRIFELASPDTGKPNYGLAGAFGVFLLFLAMLLMWGYFRATKYSERFRVISGKGFRPKRTKLGAWQPLAFAFVGSYFLIMMLPLLILLWTSLFPYYRVPNIADLANISFDAYTRVLAEPTMRRAMTNSLMLIAISGVVVMALSCLISWFSIRTKGMLGRILDIMSFAPNAIPPVVMAIALLLMFMNSPIYGTLWVLVIGHMTIYLAFGTRTMNGAFIQIHKELEDAATISGASWHVSLRRIILPIVWPQILNGWLWVVAHSARDLTFPLILLTSSNVVVAASIYLTWNYPDIPSAAAMSMLMIVALMALVVPVQLFAFRKIDQRQ